MKKALKIVYAICSFATGIVLGFQIYKAIDLGSFIAIIVFSILFIMCLIVDIFVDKSIKENEKKVALGVLSIIFVGPIAGILYLIWQPTNYTKSKLNNPAIPVEGKEVAGEYYIGDTVMVELKFGTTPVKGRIIKFYNSIGKYLICLPTGEEKLITPDQIKN